MKILATSDLHQMITKWKDLVSVCQRQKFDVVAIAGDLFPKDNGIENQIPFIKHLRKYATKINNTGAKIVLILGNDDNQNIIPEMEKSHNDGLWYYIPDKVIDIGGYEFVAMPYVPDYPFGYKFWCRAERENNLRINSEQFCEPLILNKNNKFEVIEDYPKYLRNQNSICKSLFIGTINVKNIQKSIWLIHAPPANLLLDICADGRKVGSNEIYEFIIKQQPLITIHGHIHESPEYNGNKWCHQENKTLCIQAGQIGFKLHYVIIDVENGEVKSVWHSIYGSKI